MSSCTNIPEITKIITTQFLTCLRNFLRISSNSKDIATRLTASLISFFLESDMISAGFDTIDVKIQLKNSVQFTKLLIQNTKIVGKTNIFATHSITAEVVEDKVIKQHQVNKRGTPICTYFLNSGRTHHHDKSGPTTLETEILETIKFSTYL